MLQRNAEPQSQWGTTGGSRRLENQMSSVMNAARALAGAVNAAPAEPVVAGEQYLVFTLLDHEFALQAAYVQGVERMADVTVVPNLAFWVAGVINLRGSISSVVDLRAFLDQEKLPFNPRTRLLSTKYNEMLICLVVDSVSEMVPIVSHAVDPTTRSIPQWVASYASGVATVGKRQVILLDAARLLFADKMHHYLV
ncbi:MAG TPA: chemotaxis protein CheW [Ktedonobacteraceae bacterium]